MTPTIRSIPGSASRLPRPWWRRFGVVTENDWPGIIHADRCNWSDFTLLNLSGECEWLMGNAEIALAVFGFHLTFTYFWPCAERDKLMAMKEAIERGEAKTTPWPTIRAEVTAGHAISETCRGEACMLCYRLDGRDVDATHKVGED